MRIDARLVHGATRYFSLLRIRWLLTLRSRLRIQSGNTGRSIIGASITRATRDAMESPRLSAVSIIVVAGIHSPSLCPLAISSRNTSTL